MAAIGDTLTISVFIALIIGALCFYLFTRIKQVEKKLALMEGILLDLKTATEDSFTDFPARSRPVADNEEDEEEDEEPFIPMLPEATELGGGEASGFGEPHETAFGEAPMLGSAFGEATGTTFSDVEVLEETAPAQTRTIELNETEESDAASSPTVQVNKVEETGSAGDLESKSVAELAALARNKGISGTGKMRKQQLIDVLKASESITNATPMEGPDGISAKSSLIDGSSLLASPL